MTCTGAGNLGKLPYGNVIRSLWAPRAMEDSVGSESMYPHDVNACRLEH